MAAERAQSAVICNGALGIGTFSASEHAAGFVFAGGSVSTDGIPNEKSRLVMAWFGAMNTQNILYVMAVASFMFHLGHH